MGGLFGGILDFLLERLGGTSVSSGPGRATVSDALLYGCSVSDAAASGCAVTDSLLYGCSVSDSQVGA
jgi:hypothetical protein